jgi:hypothetical protein
LRWELLELIEPRRAWKTAIDEMECVAADNQSTRERRANWKTTIAEMEAPQRTTRALEIRERVILKAGAEHDGDT